MAFLAFARPLWRLSASRLLPSLVGRDLQRSFSDQQPPMRLRRPARFQASESSLPSTPTASDQRPHTITLFPGDFGSDEDDDEFDLFDEYEDDEAEFDETAAMVEELRRREEADLRQREKWIESSKPPEREPVIDARGRAYGRGGRKRASARVWIQPGMGEVVVNRRPLVDYFARQSDRELVLQPLVATETCGKFDLQVAVQGGGLTGQAGAVRHGLANALNHYNPDLYRPPLKRLGMLTRDARKVERKVVGRVKARKSPQWVRR